MNIKFLKILRCPVSMQMLTLKAAEYYPGKTRVKSGVLVSEDGTHEYAVVEGIPRFVKCENYSSSFGYEWKKWSRVQFESENAGKPMQGHTERMFDVLSGLSGADLKGKLCVEFGCGPGRFLEVVRSRGGIAVGIDMSEAVEPARRNFEEDDDVMIVQGDILNPPFDRNIFDFAYSFGVLHHTPQPASGLENLVAVSKRGARVACCVYHRGGFYDYVSVYLYRKIHNLIKSFMGNYPALFYSYLSANYIFYILAFIKKIPKVRRIAYILEKYALVNLEIPDANWRFLDIFDAITPYYASTHTGEEVSGWFEKAGCEEIRTTEWCPTSIVAVKK